MTASRILVTGASGNTGSAVVDNLRAAGALIRTATPAELVSPDVEHVLFDWADPATHPAALAGVERVYLIAPVGVADPVRLVEPFLDQALRTGVRRVVFLSSSAIEPGDPGLGKVDALVRARAPEWAVLRCAWFMQNFVGTHPLADAIRESGEIVTACGDGRLAFVDARDIGAAAAALLVADAAPQGELFVTGPEPLSYGDAAALVSEAIGRTVRHVSVSVEARATQYVDGGYDTDFASALAELDRAVRDGEQHFVSDTVERLTGRPPRSLRNFLAEHKGELTP